MKPKRDTTPTSSSSNFLSCVLRGPEPTPPSTPHQHIPATEHDYFEDAGRHAETYSIGFSSVLLHASAHLACKAWSDTPTLLYLSAASTIAFSAAAHKRTFASVRDTRQERARGASKTREEV